MNMLCCGTPQTGGLIIGSVEIVGGLVSMIIFSSVLGSGEQKSGEGLKDKTLGFTENTLWTLFTEVKLVISIYQIIISGVLIHGIRKKSRSLMTIWMIFKFIFICIFPILLISSLLIGGVRVEEMIFYFILVALNAFYLFVIYYLREQTQPKAYHGMLLLKNISS